MPAQTLDLNGELIIEQGAVWKMPIQLPGDLTGAFLKGQIRKGVGGELVAMFQFTEFSYNESEDNSTAEMFLRSGTTQLMAIPKSPPYWLYDVKLSPRGEDPIRLFQGKVYISPGITD